jgi:hypothetical protein
MVTLAQQLANVRIEIERETNVAGMPYLHPCPFCKQDFGGKVLHHRHRRGRRSERYHSRRTECLTPEQMMERGWYMDRYGRWRDARMRGK